MARLYLAMEDELIVVVERGGRWCGESRLEGLPIQCADLDPLQPDLVYCGSFGHGLWRSHDGGTTWQPVGQGIGYGEVTAVAVSRLERAGRHGVVWAGTEPSALFRSDDGGDRWEELPNLRRLPSAPSWSFPPRPWTHHVRWIAPDVNAPRRLFVAIEAGGVMRSLDGGRSWEDRKPDGPHDAHTLRPHRQAPGRLYAAAGDGYFESRDGGESWQRVEEGLRHHYLWGVAVDPGDPDTVVVSAALGAREAHDWNRAESTVYRRSRGAPWEAVREGLPEPEGTTISTVAASESEPGVFYLANNRGIFRSDDAGLRWERLRMAWPDRFLRQRVQALVAVGP